MLWPLHASAIVQKTALQQTSWEDGDELKFSFYANEVRGEEIYE